MVRDCQECRKFLLAAKVFELTVALEEEEEKNVVINNLWLY
jgi:hypothetical protein